MRINFFSFRRKTPKLQHPGAAATYVISAQSEQDGEEWDGEAGGGVEKAHFEHVWRHGRPQRPVQRGASVDAKRLEPTHRHLRQVKISYWSPRTRLVSKVVNLHCCTRALVLLLCAVLSGCSREGPTHCDNIISLTMCIKLFEIKLRQI